MDDKYRKRYIVGLVISLVTTVMGLINPFLSSKLVDEVIVNHNVDPMLKLLLAMLAVVCVQQGMRYLMMIWFEGSAQNVVFNLKSRLFESLQHQEMSFFDRHRAGDLMTRLTGDLDWVRHFTTHIVFNLME